MRILLVIIAAVVVSPAVAEGRPTGSVKATSSEYGRILVDHRGRTLYLFTRDRRSRSRCYGACAKAWPAYLVKGTPRAGSGADPDLVGTTRRRGGEHQLTYGGRPLYHYVGDRDPGDIFCQDVFEFGGRWLLVSPRGRAVE